MRVRRIVASVAAAVMVAGFGIAGAAPAAALEVADCVALNGQSGVGVSSAYFALPVSGLVPGDSITVTTTNPDWKVTAQLIGYNLAGSDVYVNNAYIESPSGSVSLTVPDRPDVTRDWQIGLTGGDDRFSYELSCVRSSTPSLSADAPPIPAWLQSYGRFGEDATCETGWTNSWQKWAKDITGGWVCTRSIPSLG